MDRNFCRYAALPILEADIMEMILQNDLEFLNKEKEGRRDGELHALFVLIREGECSPKCTLGLSRLYRVESRLHWEWS